jgi:Lanthionine synthetase C-like protein
VTLYRPDWHEPLAGEWDEERARAGIRAIVADADAAFGEESLWPAHDWDSWRTPTPLKSLYVGAAGVLWALDELRSRGLAEPRTDLAAAAEEALAEWRREPDLMAEIELPSTKEAGLLSGESGVLLTAFRLSRSREYADDLHERVRENERSEAEDVMWGTPGTLVAAQRMLEWTGDERWRVAWRAGADALWSRRDAEGYWTQRLYGEEYKGLGTAHGLVGNVQALRPLLDPERRAQLERDTNAMLARAAFVEDGLANWPHVERPRLESAAGEIRLQWCAGAPGIVVAAADYLDEELLLAGAELVWQAGPPTQEKGAGICHGTAGNGYALLAAFGRTGEEAWLDRARAFAAHALGQVERAEGRYSLWTGGVGAALFATDCLEGRTRYPVLG